MRETMLTERKKLMAAMTAAVIAAGIFAAMPAAISADEAGDIAFQSETDPTAPIELLSAPVKLTGTFGEADSAHPGAITADLPGYDWNSNNIFLTDDYDKIVLDYSVNSVGNGGNLELSVCSGDGSGEGEIGWVSDTSWDRNNHIRGLYVGDNQQLSIDLGKYPGKYFKNVAYCLYAGINNAEGVDLDCDITINSISLYPANKENITASFENADTVIVKYPFKITGNYSTDEISVGSTFDGYPYSRQPLYSNDYETLVMDYTVNDPGNAKDFGVFLACGTQPMNSNEGPLFWDAEATWDGRGLKAGEHQQFVFDLTKRPDTYFSAVGYFLNNADDLSLAGQPCTADITINGVWLTKRQTTEQLTRTIASNVDVTGDFGSIKNEGGDFSYSNLSSYLKGYSNSDYREIDVGKYSYMEVDYTVTDPGNAFQMGVELATADYSNVISAGSWQNGIELSAGEHQKFYLDFSDKTGNTFNFIYYYLTSKNDIANTPFTGSIVINSIKFYPKGMTMPQKDTVTVQVSPMEMTVHSLDPDEQVYEAGNALARKFLTESGEELQDVNYKLYFENITPASQDAPGSIRVWFELTGETAQKYVLAGDTEFIITTNYSSRSPGVYQGIGFENNISITADNDSTVTDLNSLIENEVLKKEITLKGADGSADYAYGAIGSHAVKSIAPITAAGENSYTVDVVLDMSKILASGDIYLPEDADITLGYSEGINPETVTVTFNVNVTYNVPDVPDTPDTPDTPDVPNVPVVPDTPSVPNIPVSSAAVPRVGEGVVSTDINTGSAVTGAKALMAAEAAQPGESVDVVMNGNTNEAEIISRIAGKQDITVNLKYSGYTVSVNSDDISADYKGQGFYSSARFLTKGEKRSFANAVEVRQIKIKNLAGIEKATITVNMRGGSKGLPGTALERTATGRFREISSGMVGSDRTFTFEITTSGNYVVYSGGIED